MAGTVAGGRKAALTNKLMYGTEYYREIGKKGGKIGRTGGFHDRELARRAGALGGRISKRTKKEA